MTIDFQVSFQNINFRDIVMKNSAFMVGLERINVYFHD